MSRGALVVVVAAGEFGAEAGEGTVLAAHEDSEAVDKELERRFRPETSRRRPLYVTYSIPKGQDLPSVAL